MGYWKRELLRAAALLGSGALVLLSVYVHSQWYFKNVRTFCDEVMLGESIAEIHRRANDTGLDFEQTAPPSYSVGGMTWSLASSRCLLGTHDGMVVRKYFSDS
ncbi:MAG: hypothetical protein RJA70_81 [Pseudomonadota bacterium]|jgi:hypothetical protein